MNPYQKKCENCKWFIKDERWNYWKRGICIRYPKEVEKRRLDFCSEYTPVLERE